MPLIVLYIQSPRADRRRQTRDDVDVSEASHSHFETAFHMATLGDMLACLGFSEAMNDGTDIEERHVDTLNG